MLTERPLLPSGRLVPLLCGFDASPAGLVGRSEHGLEWTRYRGAGADALVPRNGSCVERSLLTSRVAGAERRPTSSRRSASTMSSGSAGWPSVARYLGTATAATHHGSRLASG